MERDAVLPYASGAPRPRRAWWVRHFHVWLLPLAWLPGAWGSRVHHGDEYFGFAMAHAPTLVVVAWPYVKLFGEPNLPVEQLFLLVVAIGFVLWTFVGWLLDRLRAWKSVYLIMPVALLLIATKRFAVSGHVPPIADYPGQEWERDAVYVAYCWAVYAVAIVTLIGAAVAMAGRACVRWVRAATAGRRAHS